jgi:thiamine transporter ThiT
MCFCVLFSINNDFVTHFLQIVSAIVLVFIFLYFVSEFSSYHSATAASASASLVYGSSVLGSDLRYMVHKTFAAADKDGSLVSSNVSFSPKVVNDNGIEVCSVVWCSVVLCGVV